VSSTPAREARLVYWFDVLHTYIQAFPTRETELVPNLLRAYQFFISSSKHAKQAKKLMKKMFGSSYS
jgi:hypothetical protein